MTAASTTENVPAPAIKARILFADDDEMFRGAFSRLLGRHGYECLVAPDAATALQMLHDHEVDALIADIHMPGNAGLELIEGVPQVRRGLPVILLTGRPEFETAAKSVRLSVAAYLVKPPELKELLSILEETIAQYRTLRTIVAGRQRIEKWAEELKLLEENLRRPTSDKREGGDYLRVTLQNMAIQLGELARSAATSRSLSNSNEVEKMELISALQQTISVLENTRKSFKSKELGELRKRLSNLVASRPEFQNEIDSGAKQN